LAQAAESYVFNVNDLWQCSYWRFSLLFKQRHRLLT